MSQPFQQGEVDVVIPVHGKFELTQKCLASLADQSAPHNAFVVDDGSPDDTLARLASDWPSVSVVELGANRGYTQAVNAGVAAGSGEFVIILNNDVLLRPNAVGELIAPMLEDLVLGSVAAVMLQPGGTTIDSAGMCADSTLAGFPRLRGAADSQASEPRPRLLGPDGNAGAYRRVAWEQVHGFDERMPAYLEVVDLGLRLASAGWGTVLSATAQGVHLGSGTFGARSRRARWSAAVSRGYMLRRWRVLGSDAAVRALVTELVVVVGDALLSRDLLGLKGRIHGWKLAAETVPHPWPPRAALDGSITMVHSFALRRSTL